MRKGLVLAALLVPALLVPAETQIVSPEELVGRLKVRQKVKLILKTGTYAEGRLEDVSPTRLKVNVRKSHDLRDLPTGMQELTFDRLASVTILVRRGEKRWKLPFVLCSTLGTTSVMIALATEERADTFVPVALGFTAALGLGGHYAGKAMDEEWVTYVSK